METLFIFAEHHWEGLPMALGVNGFSLIDGAAEWGLRNLQLRLKTNRGTAVVQYDKVEESGGASVGEALVLGRLRVRTEERAVDGLGAVTLTHTIENTGVAPVWISEAATGQFRADSGVLAGKSTGLGWDLRFAHTDNVRIERYPHCLMEYPFVRMLPTAPVVLGAGEDQPFPALHLRDERSASGMVIAAASQEINYLVFALQKAPFTKESVFQTFEMRHDFAQAGGLQIDPGCSVALDGLFIQLTGLVDFNDLYADYFKFLSGRFAFRGPSSRLRTEAMHCTWNYGVFADQRQEPLLTTARFISEHFPGIKFFLMDAGYLHGDIATTFLDRFYPDPNGRVSRESFPRGIRGFSDELRKLGLRPGIWWSPTAHVDSDLYRDHPDWFLRKADGGLYIIGEKNVFLDYTHPEALAHLDRTLAVILGEWGMDACKMDFWSQNFESREARLRDPTKTALQARRAFFDVIRSHLPADGVFMTCVAVGMGNPFIGQHADTYRNTIDIGVGEWREQIYNCAWALPTLTLEGRRTFLLNNDSVGVNLKAPENENFFRFTWSFMHQGMIETGGRMEQWPDVYVEAMRRVTTNIDRGYPVRCADLQAFTGAPFPKVLVVDYPEDSPTRRRGVRKHVALFNWADVAQAIGASNEQLGIVGETRVRDFWTDEEKRFGAEGVCESLPARSSRLYEIAS